MSLKLNYKKLLLTGLGALSVITGVILKNSSDQLGRPNSLYGKYIGPLFFILGWVLVVYSISGFKFEPLIIMPAVAIVFSVMVMSMKLSSNLIFPILFILGWIILAYGIGKGNNIKLFITIPCALLVLISMMYFLPIQRKKCIVDGPGLVLFTLAWVGITCANAL